MGNADTTTKVFVESAAPTDPDQSAIDTAHEMDQLNMNGVSREIKIVNPQPDATAPQVSKKEEVEKELTPEEKARQIQIDERRGMLADFVRAVCEHNGLKITALDVSGKGIVLLHVNNNEKQSAVNSIFKEAFEETANITVRPTALIITDALPGTEPPKTEAERKEQDNKKTWEMLAIRIESAPAPPQ